MNNVQTVKIKKKKTKYEEVVDFSKLFVENYRLHIGAGLFVVVIGLSTYLLWYEQTTNVVEVRIKNYELRLSELENKLANGSLQIASSKIDASGAVLGVEDASSSTYQVSSSSSNTKTTAVVPKGKVNINTASASQLDTLPGIGPAYAGRIIDYRNANGGFKTLEQIKNVKGIGDVTFNKFRDLITL